MRKSQQGSSMVGLLVAIGVGGLVMTGMSRFMTNSMKANRHVEVRGELDSVRRTLAKSFDCQKSLGLKEGEILTSCKTFPLLNTMGNSMANDKGRVGSSDIYLRTRCELGFGVFFEYQIAKDVGGKLDPIADPLTGQKKGYADLFPSEPFCGEFFSAKAAQAPTLPDIECSPGRVLLGVKGGVPICGEADPYEPDVCTSSGGFVASKTTASSHKQVVREGTTNCTKGPLKPQRHCNMEKISVQSSSKSVYIERCLN